ncbi:MAG: hypothetical protein D6820_07980 [Lentisphaerae bacterium]|nr:MAG: hypothetical protein D6820_07980 [Lentisphaerota bacterium]
MALVGKRRGDPEKFIVFWQHSPQIVTFNGKAFDEPWIVKQFGVHPHPNHLDLMHVARKHGLTGGLKKIGQVCGFPRPPELDGVDSKIAVKLWERFQRDRADEALQNLLYYNAWDVALTYFLHCRCMSAPSRAIHETIPFTLDSGYLASILPQPKKHASPRQGVGGIQEFWRARKNNPITLIRDAEVCITGELRRMGRKEAQALITAPGGIPRKSVTQRLDFLVVGDTGNYGKTGKIDQAEKNIAKGAHTRIIEEDEFWRIVEKTKSIN